MARIDIIVPSYNNLTELKQCLAGFALQTFRDFRVLLCMDGSSDGSLAYAERLTTDFEMLVLKHEEGQHRGRNATRNLALPVLDSTYLATIDSDIVPDPDFLKNHLELLEKRDCISLGQVLYTNRYDNAWADYIQSRGKNKFKSMTEIPYFYVTTGNMAMRTRYFIESGGQDANMTTYGGGDTEFAYRLHKMFHLPVIYNAPAAGRSVMNKTLPQALKQMEEFGAVNLPYIRKKHPGFNSFFRSDLFESGRLRHRILRCAANRSVSGICLSCIRIPMKCIRRPLIHFLVFIHIYLGLQTVRLQNQEESSL
ncbi:glycosyltransferase [bacterium]|nr:glycosyltransferase [bacterium]